MPGAVPDRVDPLDGGRQRVVDRHRAGLGQSKPGVPGQLDPRPGPGAQHEAAGLHQLSVGEPEPPSGLPPGRAAAERHVDSGPPHRVGEHPPGRRVELPVHQVAAPVHDRDPRPARGEGPRRLKTKHAAAEHRDPPAGAAGGLRERGDVARVRERVQRRDVSTKAVIRTGTCFAPPRPIARVTDPGGREREPTEAGSVVTTAVGTRVGSAVRTGDGPVVGSAAGSVVGSEAAARAEGVLFPGEDARQRRDDGLRSGGEHQNVVADPLDRPGFDRASLYKPSVNEPRINQARLGQRSLGRPGFGCRRLDRPSSVGPSIDRSSSG